jgi:hypothetical protein
MKMKKIAYAVAALGISTFVAGSAMAAPSSKSAVMFGGGEKGLSALMNKSSEGAATIMSSTIKTAEQKDLAIDVSLECNLVTRTKVSGQKGSKSTAGAEASVEVAVFMDGTVMAEPGWVTFCDRTQELSATLGGVLEECVVTVDPDTGVGGFTKDDCTFSDEDIELMLDTTTANSFNFILFDVGTAGSEGHMIEVKTRISDSTYGDGTFDASSNGYVGKGSVIVEEIQLGSDININ